MHLRDFDLLTCAFTLIASNVEMARVRGTRDIPETLARTRRRIREVFKEKCRVYGFQEVEVPIIEESRLYEGVLGDTSDVVHREMFRVISPGINSLDRGDSEKVLRPEGTAGVLRMAGRGGKWEGKRVWYDGAMFRYERPQHGRLRQFTQLGVELLGRKRCLYNDVDVVVLARDFLRELNPKVMPRLLLNCLGDGKCREIYCGALRKYLEPVLGNLSKHSQARFERGAMLRILDSKSEQDREVVEKAPSLLDVLSKEERERFENVKMRLNDAGVDFVEDKYLVRGLDYYAGTAFEFVDDRGQAVLGGGGYENVLGIDGIGWAAGLERLEQYVQSVGVEGEDAVYGADVAVIVIGHTNEEKFREMNSVRRYAHRVTRKIREMGLSVIGEYDAGNLKKVFGRVAGGGARWAVTVGGDELSRGVVGIKNLASGVQVESLLENIYSVLTTAEVDDDAKVYETAQEHT